MKTSVKITHVLGTPELVSVFAENEVGEELDFYAMGKMSFKIFSEQFSYIGSEVVIKHDDHLIIEIFTSES